MNFKKNLDSAHNGTKHWWMQRVTAVALIPLIVISIILVLKTMMLGEDIKKLFTNSLYAACIFLTLLISLYHSTLGIQEIIQDYIHKQQIKNILLILIKVVAFVSAALLTVTIFYSHATTYCSCKEVM